TVDRSGLPPHERGGDHARGHRVVARGHRAHLCLARRGVRVAASPAGGHEPRRPERLGSTRGRRMSAAALREVILAGIGAGLALYVLLGGADFGGGFWDLLARGPLRERERDLISAAIGPV